ncbi:MAG: hypothetical protein K2J61_00795 [Clostridia bacterium]|nr:hypothetical protein [Clostridia bacterium]
MEESNVQYKELLILNNKLLMLENLVIEYKNDVKALKICSNLVKKEAKAVKSSKIPVSLSDLNSIQGRYTDFAAAISGLIKAKKVEAYNKAVADLIDVKAMTEEEIKVLEEKLNPAPAAEEKPKISETIGTAAQKLAKKIEAGAQKLGAGAQKLGNSLSEAVNEQVDEIKKALAGDEK